MMSDSAHLLDIHQSLSEGVLLSLLLLPFVARPLGHHPEFHKSLRARTLEGSGVEDEEKRPKNEDLREALGARENMGPRIDLILAAERARKLVAARAVGE